MLTVTDNPILDFQNIYRKHIEYLRSQGDWFIFSRSYARAFGKLPGLFLADLMNFSHMRANPDGWFVCSTKDLETSDLGWERETQKKYLNLFISIELIKRENRGIPPKRHIWLDVYGIEGYAYASRPAVKAAYSPAGSTAPYIEKSFTRQKKRTLGPLAFGSGRVKPRKKENSAMGVGFNLKMDSTVKKRNGKRTVTKFDKKCAARLRSALLTDTSKAVNGKIATAGKTKKWEYGFCDLRSPIENGGKGIDPGIIDSVLDWYCANCLTVKVKHIYNGVNFCDSFGFIKDEMEKSCDSLIISESAKDIAIRFSKYHWPKGAGAQLPKAVQKTLDAFKSFSRKIADYCKNNPDIVKEGKFERPAPGHIGFAHHLSNVVNSVSWTEKWFNDIWQQRGSWNEWHGDLLRDAWDGDLNNKRFDQYIRTLAVNYGGAPFAKCWNKLKEELK